MYQMISIYSVGDQYLAHPNSIPTNVGVFVAHEPALGLQSTSSDEFLGSKLLSLLPFCDNSACKVDALNSIQCPFTSIAKIKSWSQLAKKSPTMLQLRFEGNSVEIHKWVKDGSGYTADSNSEPLRFSSSLQSSTLGGYIRKAFHPTA